MSLNLPLAAAAAVSSVSTRFRETGRGSRTNGLVIPQLRGFDWSVWLDGGLKHGPRDNYRPIVSLLTPWTRVRLERPVFLSASQEIRR
jgi:hypothetical protein